MITTMTDVYDMETTVDLDRKRLYTYSARGNWAKYFVPVMGSVREYWTEVIIPYDKSIPLEDRVRCFGSPLNIEYAFSVAFNADANDHDKKIWNAYMTWIDKNKALFFTKDGDIRRQKNIMSNNIAKAREFLKSVIDA